MKPALSMMVFVVVCIAAVMAGIRSKQTSTPSTWVDEQPITYDASDISAFQNLDENYPSIPGVFRNSRTSVARTVTDRVTGYQVLVINEGWYEGNQIKYRILRRVNIDSFEHDGDGWKVIRGKFSDFWITEERRFEELMPIPSV